MAESVTIHDVAAEAKVSIATVSRVINGMSSVKESTRERVFQAMRKVGYVISESQPAVQAGAKTILVLVTNINNLYTGKQIDGILSAANYAGYDCYIFKRKSEVYNLEQICGIAKSINACGILISWPNVPLEIINKLARVYPTVQINEYCEGSDVPFVSADDYAIGKTATSYLLRLGYRKIGLIGGLSKFKYANDRLRGYMDALREFGVEPRPERIFPATQISSVTSRIVNLDDPLDAVVATSDVQGAALVNELHAAGKEIPKDMAIISCEDTELAQYVYPPLTAVSQPIFHIGEEACKLLLSMIDGSAPQENQVYMQSDLIVRGTT